MHCPKSKLQWNSTISSRAEKGEMSLECLLIGLAYRLSLTLRAAIFTTARCYSSSRSKSSDIHHCFLLLPWYWLLFSISIQEMLYTYKHQQQTDISGPPKSWHKQKVNYRKVVVPLEFIFIPGVIFILMLSLPLESRELSEVHPWCIDLVGATWSEVRTASSCDICLGRGGNMCYSFAISCYPVCFCGMKIKRGRSGTILLILNRFLLLFYYSHSNSKIKVWITSDMDTGVITVVGLTVAMRSRDIPRIVRTQQKQNLTMLSNKCKLPWSRTLFLNYVGRNPTVLSKLYQLFWWITSSGMLLLLLLCYYWIRTYGTFVYLILILYSTLPF